MMARPSRCVRRERRRHLLELILQVQWQANLICLLEAAFSRTAVLRVVQLRIDNV